MLASCFKGEAMGYWKKCVLKPVPCRTTTTTQGVIVSLRRWPLPIGYSFNQLFVRHFQDEQRRFFNEFGTTISLIGNASVNLTQKFYAYILLLHPNNRPMASSQAIDKHNNIELNHPIRIHNIWNHCFSNKNYMQLLHAYKFQLVDFAHVLHLQTC